jgi:ribosomal protein S18 acetylase RimI-like enzyme
MSLPKVASPVTIRLAKETDAEALVALQRSIYDEGAWFVGDGPPTIESLRRKLRNLEPKMELYLLAEAKDAGALCGWLELNRFFISRMRHVAMLTLAVHRQMRRQSVGKRLLARAYAWGREVGVEKIQLNVRASNEAAIALYSVQGFVLEGHERRQIKTLAGYEDNFIMAKFL